MVDKLNKKYFAIANSKYNFPKKIKVEKQSDWYVKVIKENQIEINPFNQQIDTQKFLRDNNIQVEAWAPFAEGRNNIFKNELLVEVAAKYKKSVAQIILRWVSQRGIVVLSKSVRKGRMLENISVLDFELSMDDMTAITTLDTKTSSFFDHRDPEKVKWLGTRKLDI